MKHLIEKRTQYELWNMWTHLHTIHSQDDIEQVTDLFETPEFKNTEFRIFGLFNPHSTTYFTGDNWWIIKQKLHKLYG